MVSKEEWDKAMKGSVDFLIQPRAPINKGITIGDLMEYAQVNNKNITIRVTPDKVEIDEENCGGNDESKG